MIKINEVWRGLRRTMHVCSTNQAQAGLFVEYHEWDSLGDNTKEVFNEWKHQLNNLCWRFKEVFCTPPCLKDHAKHLHFKLLKYIHYKSSPDFTPCINLDINVINHETMISKVYCSHFFLFSVTLTQCVFSSFTWLKGMYYRIVLNRIVLE